MPSKTKQPFILNENNYFSPERPHVSTSMIKDYMLDPDYYKRKWIKRDPDLQFKVTDPMKRGLVADALLTTNNCPYQKKVLKREDPKLYELQKTMDDRYLVPPTYWDQAIQVANDLKKHPVWSEGLDRAAFQVVLECEIEKVKICGLADRVDVLPEGKFRLVDLKVVNPIKIDNMNKWKWNCIEMKYTHQLALYQYMLAQSLEKKKEDVQCAHVVAAYVNTGLTKVAAFTFTQDILDEAFEELVEAIKNIKAKRFDPVMVGWDSAKVISGDYQINKEDYGKEDTSEQDKE